MILDEQLKWNKHNYAQCKVISNKIALLKRARSFVPSETLIEMYNALGVATLQLLFNNLERWVLLDN
jgi:hypothetical protein